MKKITTYILLASFCILSINIVNAQTAVKLKFNHKLGSADYAKNTQTSNNLSHNFNVSRLEYYVSKIVVIHDGGTMDTIKDKYLLMNPSGASSTHDLSSITLTNIEAIQFSIGVDSQTNHLNPASYGSLHPLAPKSPSMHWGWTAGYRFIAIEGKSGTSLNQTYELHGLGNDNYFTIQIPVTATDDNGAKLIELNADYTEVLKDIDLNSGVIAHGDDLSDKKALENMRSHVFTSTTGQGNTLAVKKINTTEVTSYPNPGNTGTSIHLQTNSKDPVFYKVFDLNGKEILTTELNESKINLSISGVYQIIAYNSKNELVSVTKQVIL